MKLFLNTDYTIKLVGENSMSYLVPAFKQKKEVLFPLTTAMTEQIKELSSIKSRDYLLSSVRECMSV